MQNFKKRIEKSIHAVFVAPSVLLIFLLSIVPLLYAIYLSFHNYLLVTPIEMRTFNGFANYVSVLTNQEFLASISWTVTFSFFAVAISVGAALLLSVLLANITQSRGVNVMKSILILPMMIAPVVTSTMWRIMLGPVYGPVNYLLERLGASTISWTGDRLAARAAIVIIDTWGSIPFCMLIFIGALTTIPIELYESATMDGAGRFMQFRKVTFPLMRNFIALVISLRIMDSLKVFDPIMIMTNGGPSGATESMGTMIYKIAFRYMNIGEGSAASIIFFVLIAVISITVLMLTRKKEVN